MAAFQHGVLTAAPPAALPAKEEKEVNDTTFSMKDRIIAFHC